MPGGPGTSTEGAGSQGAMADFLTAQLDYVYFVYGLALVLLGATAASIPRNVPVRLPWRWLTAFALLGGAVEWLFLAELAAGDVPAIHHSIPLLFLGSYVLLAEFARRSHAVEGGEGPGAWLTVALAAAPVLLSLSRGPEVLLPATRLVLALPVTLWAAARVGAAARRAGQAGTVAAGSLGWASVSLAVYGVATGVVLPVAPFLPAGWPTAEAFLAATGLPIQVVCGAAASATALGLWAYATSIDPQGRVVRKRWRFFWVSAVTLAVVLAAGAVGTNRLGREHDQDLRSEAESTASQVQDHLYMELERATEAARTIQRLTAAFDLSPAIAAGGSARLDALVDGVAAGHPGVVAYVLDPSGKAIASSNRDRPDSFLGKVYGHRPYFRDAVEGREGRFIGVGLTSGRTGFYASAPITDAGGRVLGVAAVKQELDRESFGPLGTGTSFLVGSDGQVLLAAMDDFAGRPMWTSGGAPRSGALLPGPWAGTTWTRIDGGRYVAVRAPLPDLDWSVVTFRRELFRGTNRLLGILITLTLSVVIVASFVLLQRQLGTESRLAEKQREAEGRAREMARRADTDALTGIANRQGFNETIAREFARSRRFRHPLSIVLVDLDHFKRVNDTHGHPAGDQVLSATARLLATRVRESDFVARWGGEEFAIIASMTDAAGAARLAEKLRARMEATRLGPDGRLTASFGVAEMRPEDTVQTMLRRADEALYAAKEGGRNQVRCGEAWVDMGVIAMAESGAGLDPAGRGPAPLVETGIPELDAEHRELSGALSEFVTLVDGGDASVVVPAMAGILDLASGHFAHEEDLMRRRAYPARSRHEEAHILFVADARRFQVELVRNGVTPAFRQWAATRLPEWFRYHILAHDVALGRFLSGAPHSISNAR